MKIDDQIANLLAQADELRKLDDEAAEAAGLPAIVDKINALRAWQADARVMLDQAIAESHEAEFAAIAESVSPKRRGRPKKAD